MNKILVGIPVITCADHCARSFRSVINEADLLVIDNNADQDVRDVIPACATVIRNQENIYVNPAWNQIIEYFLKSDYETLIIMNSDLVMQPEWTGFLSPDMCCVPTEVYMGADEIVTQGTPGIFIHLTRVWAAMVYPIPRELKVWFGDEWIYGILRQNGIKTVIRRELRCEHIHHGSQTVTKVPGIYELIEKDKEVWELLKPSFSGHRNQSSGNSQ